VPVTQAGQGFVGMPAGVGDCCAPKLLHAAYQQGLQPVSMCEVWFGSGPGTATKAKQGRPIVGVGLDPSSSRQHCRLYGPCEKCCAILGTMLCSEQLVN
jgi:tRNA pseudouridine32 synthase/23S rRNA pseudouridine746 synthase